MRERRTISSPVEGNAARTIGSVESVAPNRLVALLDLDAPQATALNAGAPVGFPRLNSFVIVPHESGALVGFVSWLGIEHSNYPKRPGLKDFGLVDLPFPARKMAIVPVGTLERNRDDAGPFRLKRGVTAFPSVGDPVTLPSVVQLESILRGSKADQRVHIGRALLANNTEVRVDPDKLFGRHLAILGNTGSGKSCSVAGLIRWSLEAARAERSEDAVASSRFIVLDPNGEYSETFADLPGYRRFQAPPVTKGAEPLKVPAWLMNSHEWASVTYASARAQRPVLVQGLRYLRTGSSASTSDSERLSRLARAHAVRLDSLVATHSYMSFPANKNFGSALLSMRESFESFGPAPPCESQVSDLIGHVQGAVDERLERGLYWSDFSLADIEPIREALNDLIAALPSASEIPVGNEDLPLPFDADELADQFDVVASLSEFDDSARYIGGLKIRTRSMLNDERIRPILRSDDEPDLDQWLEQFLGTGKGDSIAVIDLSLVPSDVVQVVVAVAARLIFEALQRHRKIFNRALPTALVLEEAHNFVKRGSAASEELTPHDLCTQAFERIAREGRKFGLGLVLSSQRPSELSPTVLAQCNSFLLHRLVNEHDQNLVSRLVPDNLGALLDDLPSLPSRHALLLGWAATVPTLVEMRELIRSHRPLSDDPSFWGSWTEGTATEVSWQQVAADWVGEADPADADRSDPLPF
jgi:DNA helicase HerA-like ATPase